MEKIAKKLSIGLVAHDNRKSDMIQWVLHNHKTLMQHKLVCTGTTGKLIKEALKQKRENIVGEIWDMHTMPTKPNINDKKIYHGYTDIMSIDVSPQRKYWYAFVETDYVYCDTLDEVYEKKNLKIDVECLSSGPLGGDQQIGSKIVSGDIDILIFLADHLSTQPHDVDVKALIRLAGLYNIPMACNRASADMLITSSLFNNPEYQRIIPDFSDYTERKI